MTATRPAPPHSLRRRLTVALVAVLGLGGLLLAVALYLNARHEIDELLDAQLAQTARTALALHAESEGRHEDREYEYSNLGRHHEYERKIALTIYAPGRAEPLLLIGPSPLPVPPRCNRYNKLQLDEHAWRSYCLEDGHGNRYIAGQSESIRRELAGKILLSQFVPVLLGLPLIGLLVWLSVRQALTPLAGVSTAVAARGPNDLTPVDASAAPAEVQPLMTALNTLLSRIGAALENERRFTADAAHELRTPLAALRTQAEVARAQADTAQLRETLDKVIRGVDRATRLLEQLLLLARLDETTMAAPSPQPLHPIATSVVGDIAQQAIDRQIELELNGDETASAAVDPMLLAIALRNLVDNAIRYTPPGGQVTITLAPDRIAVSDTGPGMDQAELGRATARFFRGSDVTASGSGLGLSIVERIMALHRGRLLLASTAQGLTATLQLG